MGIKFKLDVTLTKIKGATIQAGRDGRRWLCLDDPAVFYKDKNGDIKLDLVCFEKQSQYSSGFVKRSRRKEEPQSNDDPILGNYKTFGSEGSAAPSNRPAFE